MKFEAINNAAKMQLTEKLAAISALGNVEFIRKLEAVRNDLNRQSAVESKDVLDIDARLFKYLTELEKDIRQGSYRVADIRLKKIALLMTERGSLCSASGSSVLMTKADAKARAKAMKLMVKSAQKGGFDLNSESVSITELYSDGDLYEIMTAQMQDECERIKQEIADYENKMFAAPGDMFVKSKLDNARLALSGIQQKMKIVCDESQRNNYIAAMQSVNEADKAAIAARSVSDEQLKAVQAGYNEVMRRRENDSARLGSDINSFINNGEGFVSGSVSVQDFGAAKSAVRASTQSFSQLYSSIDTTVRALERNRDIYAAKLDEWGKKLKTVDKELLSLLEKRKDMTASERLILDGKIDSLNSERNSIVTSIKKYRQIQAVNDDRTKLAKDLQQQMEINKVEAEAGRLSGAEFQDWEQVALDLNKYVRSGNEELERMADANAVASSEDIDMHSATGTRLADTETIDSDDNKYARLERELGMV